jgi:hypothetical protein
MGDEQEIQELKADMKTFARSLASGDSHFEKLDNNILDIKEDMIKVKYALFGNGVNGVTQNIELILKRMDTFTNSCTGAINSENIKKITHKIEEQRIIVEEHEQIVKTAKSVLKIFKWVGLGSLVLIGMAITNSVYNFILYLVTLL